MEKSDKITKLVEAINNFGLKLYSQLVLDGSNVFFSPFSISVALSMLLKGAKNESANELKKTLNFVDIKLSEEEIHASFCSLLETCAANQEFFSLSTANAIVCHKDFQVFPAYILDLKKIYKALVMEIDNPSTAVSQINNWVSQNTNGKISKVFDSLEENVVMILLNCIYFKGFWEYQFNPKYTSNLAFYNNGLKTNAKIVPVMSVSKEFLYVEKDTYSALELPYKGGHLSMLLFLPNELDGLKRLEENLTTAFISQVIGDLRSDEVDVFIPKLRMEYSKSLIPTLKKLGVNEIFECRANLTGLSNSKRLKVSEVIHKAVVEINEEGTEAAAVTAVKVECYSARLPNPIFNANHPFLFTIYDKKNNLMLFFGRVEEL